MTEAEEMMETIHHKDPQLKALYRLQQDFESIPEMSDKLALVKQSIQERYDKLYPPMPKVELGCTCDIRDLVVCGCKCGGFKREMARTG